MKKTLQKTLTSKKGITINAGETVTVKFDVKSKNTGDFLPQYFSVNTSDGRRIATSRLSNVGLKAPSLKTLERYSFDGIAKSVFGHQTEPDGWDSEGSPSWLLALGYI